MTNLELGDLVVLTGKGCNQPAPELMAIWTVEHLTPIEPIWDLGLKPKGLQLAGFLHRLAKGSFTERPLR